MTTKIRLSAEARKAAKSLAVAYSAWHQAVQSEDDNGKIIWGERLLERMAQLNIDLADVQNTRDIIERARHRRAA